MIAPDTSACWLLRKNRDDLFTWRDTVAAESSNTSNTPITYTIGWLWGQHTELAFDPNKDVLDFGWFSASSFSLSEINGSVLISIPSNQQSYTLTGVRFADLSARNIVAKDTQTQTVWTNALAQTNSDPDAVADTPPATPTAADIVGSFMVNWAWNQQVVVEFDPRNDRIDFGWMGPDNFSAQETDGSVVITVVGNQQTYTLQGVTLAQLSLGNISALDANTLSKWQSVLDQPVDVPQEPDAPAEPDPAEPDPVEPDPVEPDPVEPDPAEPDPVEPDPVEPDPVEPDPVEPDPDPVDEPTPAPAPAPAPVSPPDASSGHKPILAAYFPEWAIYGRDYNVSDIPADDLTHLIYAFAQIDQSGRIALFDPYAAVEKTFNSGNSVSGLADSWGQEPAGNFNQLAQLKAAHPELNTMIAIGGWTLSGPFSDLAATAQGRANFADSAVEFLTKYPVFDGLDFDWEYPGGGGLESNTVRAEDGENYALLLKVVRERLDELEAQTGRTYEISVAAPAGSDKIANFNLTGLEPYVDFFNLMAYDFHGGWENITGHQAPMFDTIGGNYDIATAVSLYKAAGIDSSKIVLGAPAYTRAWAGVTDSDGDGGWQEVTSQLAPGSFERGVYDYKDVAQKVLDKNLDWTLYWDDEAQAAYVFSESEGIFSSFETPTSIALKSQWAQSEGLGGMMFWDLSGDISSGPESLTNAAFRSWYGGESVAEISASSALQVDIVIGGNGLMDSFVDYVYVPPEMPISNNDPSGSTDTTGGSAGPVPSGETFMISWSWGVNAILDFNPRVDKLNFGWMSGDSFTLAEKSGSVVIEIPSNLQSYTLSGVAANEMSLQNIEALDPSTMTQWGSFLG